MATAVTMAVAVARRVAVPRRVTVCMWRRHNKREYDPATIVRAQGAESHELFTLYRLANILALAPKPLSARISGEIVYIIIHVHSFALHVQMC